MDPLCKPILQNNILLLFKLHDSKDCVRNVSLKIEMPVCVLKPHSPLSRNDNQKSVNVTLSRRKGLIMYVQTSQSEKSLWSFMQVNLQ